MRFFEDLVVGEVELYDAAPYLVTEDEILEFGRRWDPQPFHTDPIAARQTPFGGLVASSVHLFAMTVGIGMRAARDDPYAAVSALGFDNMRLHGSARPGDELVVRAVVIEARPSNSRPDAGVARTRTDLLNQRQELIFSFETVWLVARRPPAPGPGSAPPEDVVDHAAGAGDHLEVEAVGQLLGGGPEPLAPAELDR